MLAPNVFNPEVHRRVQAFDAELAAAQAILANPAVAASYPLDEYSTLSRMMETVFMPNLRNGAVTVPRSQIDTANLALLPLSTPEIEGDGIDLTEAQQILPTLYPLEPEYVESYGRVVTPDELLRDYRTPYHVVLRELFSGAPELLADRNSSTEAVGELAAYADNSFVLSADGYRVTRPIIRLNADVTKREDVFTNGITLLHESGHVIDFWKHNAIASLTFRGIAHSEILRYRRDALTADILLVDGGTSYGRMILDVHDHYADPEKPNTPTPAGMRQMHLQWAI